MRALGGGLLVVLVVVAAGFVAERIFGPGADPMAEAREAAESVAYSVSMREASQGVLVGAARGGHGAIVHFAISEAEGDRPEDIPPRLIQVDKNVGESGGFSVWDDSEARRHGEPMAEWRERTEIAASIEAALAE